MNFLENLKILGGFFNFGIFYSDLNYCNCLIIFGFSWTLQKFCLHSFSIGKPKLICLLLSSWLCIIKNIILTCYLAASKSRSALKLFQPVNQIVHLLNQIVCRSYASVTHAVHCILSPQLFSPVFQLRFLILNLLFFGLATSNGFPVPRITASPFPFSHYREWHRYQHSCVLLCSSSGESSY